MSATSPAMQRSMDAFERLYAEQVAFVWRSLRALGVPQEALEDASQDVFLVVHRRRAAFLGGDPRTWLFAIARRVAFRYRRTKDRAERKAVRMTDAPELARDVDDPASAVDQQTAHDVLLDFVDGLDEDKRVAFVMYYLEEMPAKAIADVLDVGVNTVHSRLRLCRERFDRHCRRAQARDARVLSLGRAAHGRAAPHPEQAQRMWAILLPLVDVASAGKVVATVGVVAQLKWFVGTLLVGFVGLGSASVATAEFGEVRVPEITVRTTPVRDFARRASERVVQDATPTAAPMPVMAVHQHAAPEVQVPKSTNRPVGVRGDDLVDAETHAVDRIRALLDEQRIDDALSGFADAERLFGPNSQLAPQRHGIEAIARCKREPDESIAATFVAAHPSSSLVGRVRKACKATGEGP